MTRLTLYRKIRKSKLNPRGMLYYSVSILISSVFCRLGAFLGLVGKTRSTNYRSDIRLFIWRLMLIQTNKTPILIIRASYTTFVYLILYHCMQPLTNNLICWFLQIFTFIWLQVHFWLCILCFIWRLQFCIMRHHNYITIKLKYIFDDKFLLTVNAFEFYNLGSRHLIPHTRACFGPQSKIFPNLGVNFRLLYISLTIYILYMVFVMLILYWDLFILYSTTMILVLVVILVTWYLI